MRYDFREMDLGAGDEGLLAGGSTGHIGSVCGLGFGLVDLFRLGVTLHFLPLLFLPFSFFPCIDRCILVDNVCLRCGTISDSEILKRYFQKIEPYLDVSTSE